MEAKRWIIQNPKDDVATAVAPLSAGETMVDTELGVEVTLVQDIPFGHKFALHDIAQGAKVHKYGQVIGRATQAIAAGEHVHVHNLESLRGRGDLQRQGDGSMEAKSCSR
ncbi:MAG: UxaA family hydrolase [Alicyclobacillus herbarius]|uniref:UxaA family hydrolase n=1 Tax=Alicyclobacillus herbarius TaxID=122960 RepID=UPI00040F4645|nr:UxaA family hydrolase [Alicyclobacillus herbarius]MCL6632581.1 UxaA family hydrolase [Alicyclobacillus herbarius]